MTNSKLNYLYPSSAITLDRNKIKFLFRRLAYGIPEQELNKLSKTSPLKLIDHLILKAEKDRVLPQPKWSDWTLKDYEKRNGELKDKLIEKQFYEYISTLSNRVQEKGLKGKLILFWSNHFVTEFWDYESPIMLHKYLKIIQKYALGNFKEFVLKIGLTPAMLFYLNGNENTAKQPNENYARELLELFTLGRDNNYTQKDITEIARAFSGYEVLDWTKIYLNKDNHDSELKNIFGVNNSFNYNQVIDLLFKKRKKEIAQFICTKIYKAFVSHQINKNIIQELSNVFIQHNFELKPVFIQLFKSDHFLSAKSNGTLIKSPFELHFIFMNELGIKFNNDLQKKEAVENLEWCGQALFNPPNVAGWKGQRHWINATSFTKRWQILDGLLYDVSGKGKREILISFTKKIVSNYSDPAIITKAIIDYFIPRKLQSEEEYIKAVKHFKGEWPEEVFETRWWNLDREDTEWQVAGLISYLFRLPEFHLC